MLSTAMKNVTHSSENSYQKVSIFVKQHNMLSFCFVSNFVVFLTRKLRNEI